MTESASEWSDSASIADEPVTADAPNFAIAIATLAASAVMTAARCSEAGTDTDNGPSSHWATRHFSSAGGPWQVTSRVSAGASGVEDDEQRRGAG